MDPRLHQKLQLWHEKIESLKSAEFQCLSLEANEKALYSKLFLSADGKTVAEREAQTHSHPDFIALLHGIAEAKSEMNHAKRVLELQIAAYQATYLTSKNEYEAIMKYPKNE